MNTKKNSIIAGASAGLMGEVAMPGDKSISHRAVILGSIADGVTEVSNFLAGEDNFRTIAAFARMGINIEGPEEGGEGGEVGEGGRGGGGKLRINGRGLNGLREPQGVIDCGNSGTTARLLMGLLSPQSFSSTLTGDASLRKRPMKRVVEPLLRMGANIAGGVGGEGEEGAEGAEYLPVTITGSRLKGIEYRTPVASAQVKSALLLAGLYAEGETVVEEPQKSRDHTERLLKLFSADVEVGGAGGGGGVGGVGGTRVCVRKTGSLKGCRITVPGDISSAAFFIVAAAITPRSELLVKGVGVNPTRTGIIDILKRMGASVETVNPREVSGEPVADILVKSSQLKGIDISGRELLPAIDEFPVICVAAARAEGITTITGAGELRVKESDRIAAMAGALNAVGIKVEERADGIVIEGSRAPGGGGLRGGSVESHGDHRIAMAMTVAGLASEKGVTIEGADCVDVSFPGFFTLLKTTLTDSKVIVPGEAAPDG